MTNRARVRRAARRSLDVRCGTDALPAARAGNRGLSHRLARTRRESPRGDGHGAAAHDGHDVGDCSDAFQESVDVLTAADDFDGVVTALIVEHARIELLERGGELVARRRSPRRSLNSASSRSMWSELRHVGDVDDVDELAELLARSDRSRFQEPARDERQTRDGFVGRRRDVQALDVVAARGKEIRDARKRAGFVLQRMEMMCRMR